ncbi:MAG: hypothetical protein OXB88_00675 [Bacteriovoracales bacterium]|nr:hypothetical protein [Bacteriovoracales bacterium]
MKNDKGQSTIEFLISFVFSLGILLVFIQLAVNLTGGFLAHYATYMASRTFLVYEEGRGTDIAGDYRQSVEKAQEVFDSYNVKIFGVYDSQAELKFNFEDDDSRKDYAFTGAYYLYRQPISLFDYFGGDVKSTMRSESFLGKEPTRGECWARTKAAIDTLGIPSDLKRYVTVFDNGC